MDKNINECNCFTAGELASLFGISKQTLLYYDKIHLLSPDFIGENGYRHYSVAQYLDLEIIVNLRSLNISLADIKYYLEHRNKECFLEQLQKRATECAKIIKENERICRSIQRISANIQQNNNLPLNQITVTWKEQRYIRLTELYPDVSSKERIAKFARHSQLAAHNKGFIERQAGWIVAKERVFTAPLPQKAPSSHSFFSFADNPPTHPKTALSTLPTGLYLELYFSGPFCSQAHALIEKIAHFMKINEFEPCSDLYVLPIENHWLYADTKQYINLLFVQVRSTAKNK